MRSVGRRGEEWERHRRYRQGGGGRGFSSEAAGALTETPHDVSWLSKGQGLEEGRRGGIQACSERKIFKFGRLFSKKQNKTKPPHTEKNRQREYEWA